MLLEGELWEEALRIVSITLLLLFLFLLLLLFFLLHLFFLLFLQAHLHDHPEMVESHVKPALLEGVAYSYMVIPPSLPLSLSLSLSSLS